MALAFDAGGGGRRREEEEQPKLEIDQGLANWFKQFSSDQPSNASTPGKAAVVNPNATPGNYQIVMEYEGRPVGEESQPQNEPWEQIVTPQNEESEEPAPDYNEPESTVNTGELIPKPTPAPVENLVEPVVQEQTPDKTTQGYLHAERNMPKAEKNPVDKPETVNTPSETYQNWQEYLRMQDEAERANDELFRLSNQEPDVSVLGNGYVQPVTPAFDPMQYLNDARAQVAAMAANVNTTPHDYFSSNPEVRQYTPGTAEYDARMATANNYRDGTPGNQRYDARLAPAHDYTSDYQYNPALNEQLLGQPRDYTSDYQYNPNLTPESLANNTPANNFFRERNDILSTIAGNVGNGVSDWLSGLQNGISQRNDIIGNAMADIQFPNVSQGVADRNALLGNIINTSYNDALRGIEERNALLPQVLQNVGDRIVDGVPRRDNVPESYNPNDIRLNPPIMSGDPMAEYASLFEPQTTQETPAPTPEFTPWTPQQLADMNKAGMQFDIDSVVQNPQNEEIGNAIEVLNREGIYGDEATRQALAMVGVPEAIPENQNALKNDIDNAWQSIVNWANPGNEVSGDMVSMTPAEEMRHQPGYSNVPYVPVSSPSPVSQGVEKAEQWETQTYSQSTTTPTTTPQNTPSPVSLSVELNSTPAPQNNPAPTTTTGTPSGGRGFGNRVRYSPDSSAYYNRKFDDIMFADTYDKDPKTVSGEAARKLLANRVDIDPKFADLIASDIDYSSRKPRSETVEMTDDEYKSMMNSFLDANPAIGDMLVNKEITIPDIVNLYFKNVVEPGTGNSGSGNGTGNGTSIPEGSRTYNPSYEQGGKVVKAPYKKGGYSEDELKAMGNKPYKDYRGYDAYEGYYYNVYDKKWYPVDQDKANYYNTYGTYRGYTDDMKNYYNTFGTYYGYRPGWRTAGRAGGGGGSRGGGGGGGGGGGSYGYGSSTPVTKTQSDDRVNNIMKNWSF